MTRFKLGTLFRISTAALVFGPQLLMAQDATGRPSGDQGFTQTIVMLAIAVLFFYFILFRPEQKRRKELEERRESLNKGDRVIAMGIVGTVSKVQEETVILKMVDGAKIEVVKAAVNEVISSAEGTADSANEDSGK